MMEIPSNDMHRNNGLYQQALQLRRDGQSIKCIAKNLKISTSTASLWCRNVNLSPEQKEALESRGMNHELLRKYAHQRHLDKESRNSTLFDNAKLEIKNLIKNRHFVAGLMLYWAEGFKNEKEQRVGFCNSDPRMIRFIMRWFREVLKISDKDFILRAEFNVSNENRKNDIELYWSNLINIPISQFNNPYLQKTNHIKNYENKNKYYGLLRIRIRKSSQLLTKIRGWIEGVANSNIKP